MQRIGRKRQVTTCVPCYKRKQKCSRQYPCNHCTRRRRPEECIYESPPVNQAPRAGSAAIKARLQASENVETLEKLVGTQELDQSSITPNSCSYTQHSALSRSFGYFEDSNSNTMALLRNVDLDDECETETSDKDTSSRIFETIRRDIERMPHRQVLDPLVQYFVSELNWMKQLVHVPAFLAHYQKWWSKDRPMRLEDVEFAVLILRICSYAILFLPSPSFKGDEVGGQSFSEIRHICGNLGDSLAESCAALDWKGSMVRVQHLLFAALAFSCEGRTDKFWEGIASACRASQKAGLHANTSAPTGNGTQELEKEIRRRTICNLYLLDSHLSRQLDRVPFLPDNLVSNMLPRLRLGPEVGGVSDVAAPEMFTERLMQVQLGRFWRKVASKRHSPYDPTQGEQIYEQFCSEYLPTLPPALSLEPETKWDDDLPKLPMQRELLHIAIFDSVCWNFKPLLLLTPSQIETMPPYKQVLLQSQKQRLALAAIKELDAISTLHSMFGSSHTRFAAIIFNSFETSVLLLTLCLHQDFPFEQRGEQPDILGLNVRKLTRHKAIQSVEKSLARLQMLAEISDMAASGARIVSQLFVRATAARSDGTPKPTTPTPVMSSTFPRWQEPSLDFLGLDRGSGEWVPRDLSNTALPDFVDSGNVYNGLQLSLWDPNIHWSQTGEGLDADIEL
ncbi:uncharacterized protein BJX67DRAFT_354362 [Aspergillus lucknowensis]|uniref:Zn(2)-C6 fungal-type domain-containing protein n=1 Tax=Aspergillus lucknowensis TaxID=176173 RepID=A0ABR4LR37_9EURO